MPSLPELMPTQVSDETFGGVTYHIAGELVPVLSVDVTRMPVYFEHHILLWKNSTITIGLKSLKGALKRMMAGMQIFVTEASGAGIVAFSRDGPGHIVPIHLRHGEEIQVREHQFLAATGNVDYTFERVRGLATMLFGQSGFFIDRFRGDSGDASSGCTAMATSSKRRSPPAKPSTSNQAAGCSRMPRSGWRPRSIACRAASSAPT